MKKKILTAVLIILITACAVVLCVLSGGKKDEEKIEDTEIKTEDVYISILQYETGIPKDAKKVEVTDSEDIAIITQNVENIKPLSDDEMVELALLCEVSVLYGEDITIDIQLDQKKYCYYTDKKNNVKGLAYLPSELYDIVINLLNR